MAGIKETTEQGRAEEARLDEEVVAALEQATETIRARDRTIADQNERIRQLETGQAEHATVLTAGVTARNDRMTRKRSALEAYKRLGVAILLLVGAGGLAYEYPYTSSEGRAQLASQEEAPVTPGFPQRSAA